MKLFGLSITAMLLFACGEKEETTEPSTEPATEPSGEPSEEVVDGDEDGVPAEEDCNDDDATMPNDDADCDGILTEDDCDDEDETSNSLAEDGDCDGVLTADDCDDSDADSYTIAEDGDCDGTLTADDCDDSDSSSTVVADDADCDGVLTADDCDDSDPSSTIIADDADCDGALTADDCDDSDVNLGAIAQDGDCDGVVVWDDCDDSDPSSTIVADDGDCDGSLTADDCDDTDPTSYPGAEEVWYNGVDNDCSGVGSDYDQDFDGYDSANHGGTDCDDTDGSLTPEDLDLDGYSTCEGDCNDFDEFTFPGAAQGVSPIACMTDEDDDGFGSATPAVGATPGTDCDDTDANTFVGAAALDSFTACMTDVDGDNYGDISVSGSAVAGSDCDDSDFTVNPAAIETWYDGVDQNCDGASDFDADGDGEDSDAYSGTDCDDNNANTYAGATEVWYNGVDNDCSGNVSDYDQDGDGEDSADYGGTDCNDIDANTLNNIYYLDSDFDGYGDAANPITDCTLPPGYADNDLDCNDDITNGGAAVNPDAIEVCDEIDNDCNGDIDDDDSGVDVTTGGNYYLDSDQDGFGDSGNFVMACEMPSGHVDNADDCDDIDAAINPDAIEVCDEIDNDCNGLFDDNDSGLDLNSAITWYEDADSDGQGVAGNDVLACVQPSTHVANFDDCDDSDSTIFTGAPELCDGIFNDCNDPNFDTQMPPLNETDNDGDGFIECDYGSVAWKGLANNIAGGLDCDDGDSAVYPAAPELCDGIFNDCEDPNYSSSSSPAVETDDDGDFYVECSNWVGALGIEGDDCDDSDVDINPGVTEIWYNGVDDDCSGNISDFDADGDGDDSDAHGGADCDDTDTAINPAATEIWYDGVDQDCSGGSDYDQDEDGEDSDAHGGLDCDDTDSLINTIATETYYDGVDQDCDGLSDFDADMDGEDSDLHGGLDCDDTDSAINTSAAETYYDGVDQDCDGLSDYDADMDGEDSVNHGGLDCDDTDASVFNGDEDGDGYVSCVDDCDDTDPTVNPGETEVWYDGIDQDCSGGSDYDQDGDGFDSDSHGGDDCDDADAAIFVGASEVWYDGIDQACDGGNDFDQDGDGEESDLHGGLDCDDTDSAVNTSADDGSSVVDGIDNDCDGIADEESFLDISVLSPGDLIITEIMPDPTEVSDSNGEWFEIYNDTGVGLNLDGLGFSDDGSDDFTVSGDLYLPADSYLVMAKNADSSTNGGFTADYDYGSGMGLTNSSDEIHVYTPSDTIDYVAWDNGATFPDQAGASIALNPGTSAADNDSGFSWCEGTTPYGDGDLGTPGAENDACPTLTWVDDIQPILQSYSCTGCHSSRMPDLSTILGVQAGDRSGINSGANMPWITPGDPSLSYFLHKINGTQGSVGGGGGTMPSGGSVSQSDIDTIELWINQGAN